MDNNKMSALYGQGLYHLAAEEGQAGEIHSQLLLVRDLLKAEPEYVTLLGTRLLSQKQRLALLDEAFFGQVQPYLLNMLKLMLEKNLLHSFGAAVRAFETLWYEGQGIAPAVVTSAVPLTEEEQETLRTGLEKKTGKKIVLETKTDASLVGGMKVELEGRTLDGSVAARLSGVRRGIEQAVV